MRSSNTRLFILLKKNNYQFFFENTSYTCIFTGKHSDFSESNTRCVHAFAGKEGNKVWVTNKDFFEKLVL